MGFCYFEVELMLTKARYYLVAKQYESAISEAERAISFARDFEYRLKEADGFLVLAEAANLMNKERRIKKYVVAAVERASCDDAHFRYLPVLNRAKGLARI